MRSQVKGEEWPPWTQVAVIKDYLKRDFLIREM